jgi:hypothetical protein
MFLRRLFPLISALLPAVLWIAPAAAEDPTFPPGSRIGLVPPTGFTINSAIHGFDDKANEAAILTFELPTQNYAELEKSMTDVALQKQGMTLDKRKDLDLKDGKAIMIEGPQNSEHGKIRKWIMVITRPDWTPLITVQIPEAAKDIYPDSAVEAALTSVALRPSIPVQEELGLLPFRFDDLAGFRVVRVLPGNVAMLTDGPDDSIEAVKQPHVLVTIGAGGPEDASSRANFARNQLFGISGFKDVKMVNSELLRLNGQQIQEIIADAADAQSGAELKVVQWLRFGTSAYIQIVAVAPRDTWLDDFSRFRAIRDGIRPQ